MKNLQCLLGRHDFGPWILRPTLIGTRVEWLHYDRECRRRRGSIRCHAVDRRWWKVRVPRSFRAPGVGDLRALPVETYLARLKVTPPRPESLPPGGILPPPGALDSVRGR
jgi:hypothetical protein